MAWLFLKNVDKVLGGFSATCSPLVPRFLWPASESAHAFICEWLVDSLSPFCDFGSLDEMPASVRTDNRGKHGYIRSDSENVHATEPSEFDDAFDALDKPSNQLVSFIECAVFLKFARFVSGCHSLQGACGKSPNFAFGESESE